MSQAARPHHASKIKPPERVPETTGSAILQALYEPVAKEIEAVEQLLREEMRSRYPSVDELVRYGCLLGGKRLRPALLLLVGKACGQLRREHVVLGAVVEMIHTATLVHDDVLDEAETRRHLATVNSRWDNKSSVLLGDFLFTHAFYLASTLDSTWACRQIGRATNVVCEGELRQKGTRGDYRLSEQEYLEIISAKTAELVACSCQLGAHHSGAELDVVENMTDFGRHLGIAFQIVDDLLDLLGDEDTTGKSLGTDLEQQKPTLPIIHALEQLGGERHAQLLAFLQDEGRESRIDLTPLLEETGSLQYARDVAAEHVRQARQKLAAIPDSDVKELLQQMTQFVLARSL